MKRQAIKDLARTVGTLGLISVAAVHFAACKRKTVLGGSYGAALMSVEVANTQDIPVKSSYDVHKEGASRQYNVDVGTDAELGLSLADAVSGGLETSKVPVGARCTVTLSYGRGAENGQATADVVLCKDQQGECGTMEDWGPKEKCLSLTNNVSTQLVRLPGGDCGFSLDRWTATMKGISFAAGHNQQQGAGLTSEIDTDFESLPVGSNMYEKTIAATTDATVSIGDVQISLNNAFQATNLAGGGDGTTLSLDGLDKGGVSELHSITTRDGDFLVIFQEGSGGGEEGAGLIDRQGRKFNGKPPKLKEKLKGLGLLGGDVSGGPGGTFKLACQK